MRRNSTTRTLLKINETVFLINRTSLEREPEIPSSQGWVEDLMIKKEALLPNQLGSVYQSAADMKHI